MKNFIRLLIGSGENCADIRYASGVSTPDDFICFVYENEINAIFSPLEIDRAKSCAKPGVRVFSEKDFSGPRRIDILCAISEKCQCKTFAVPENFPFGVAEAMRNANLEVILHPGEFFPEREYKTPEEVRHITAAQRAAEAGFARAVEVLKETDICKDTLFWKGEILTSEILRAEIDSAILHCNMLPTGTICAGGSQAAQPHNSGSGALKANAPIVMDIFPRSPETGYWGDLTRTVVRGKASDVVKRAYEAVFEAREYAKSILRPGIAGATVHCAAEAILEKHRFFSGVNDSGQFGFFHGLGHGAGLEIHEAPRLSPRSAKKLSGGEVVTVEPGLYYPEWGGIRLEDLMYITPDGSAECITKAPDFLIVE